MLTRRFRSYRSSTRTGVSGTPRHLLSALSLAAPLFVLAQALTSCGSDDDEGATCGAGDLRACAGPGSCEGTQTCAADGQSYSACVCDDGSGSAGAAGAAGAGGNNGGGAGTSSGGAAGSGPVGAEPLFDPAARVVGAPCNTDADCPVGPGGEAPLVCITPTSSVEFGTGSPQGGYCTAPCRASTECQALDGLSACGLLDDAGDGYCIGLCVPGASPVKCQTPDSDRAQACFAFPDDPEGDLGACFPVCQSDAGCGANQFCDLGASGLGLCVTTAPVGGDIGAPCTVETAATDCKSATCVTLLDPASGDPAGSFCSANCTFGLIAGCGFEEANSDTVPRDAVCVQTQLDGGDQGDIGFCFELCDADADCTQPGWFCSEDFTPDGQVALGRLGQCLPPALDAGGGVVVDAGAN